ncbi:MAG: serine/threonine protein kinase [Pseudomonadota bacterium]
MTADTAPYAELTPHTVLDAVASTGLEVDGRLLALNSFENRVYQVGVEDAAPVVTKFYRPGRWTDESIREEHGFSCYLAELDLPVVPPLAFDDETLLDHEGYRFAVFPRQGGREPVLESDDNLAWMGRLLGRLHRAAQDRPFRHRQRLLDVDRTAEAVQLILESPLLPLEARSRYEAASEALLNALRSKLGRSSPAEQSIHGDCHRGNVLWTDSGPHLVDLDDCQTGPAVQDFWMLLDGDPDARRRQLDALLEGYEQFATFNWPELQLVEALRAQRMMEYAAWIAKRWDDPAFPRLFPWFAQARYWDEHVLSLTEQLKTVETEDMFH